MNTTAQKIADRLIRYLAYSLSRQEILASESVQWEIYEQGSYDALKDVARFTLDGEAFDSLVEDALPTDPGSEYLLHGDASISIEYLNRIDFQDASPFVMKRILGLIEELEKQEED